MKIGIFAGTTDYAAPPHGLAIACEERGFESFWVPEHTHIPASRETPYPGGGKLPKDYSHLHDPFVSLAAAAAVTQRIGLGTAVCLVGEHDPITLAKQVASVDHISGGRLMLGIGAGWNREEMSNHGVDPARRWKVVRERVEAMKAIWANDEASYHGEFVNFDRIWCWPKPLQRPHPPILLGAAAPQGRARVVRYCDGWLPFPTPRLADEIDDLHKRAREAGRDPAELSITLVTPRPREEDLCRYRDMGVDRAILFAPAEPLDELLPRLDRHAGLIQKLEG
jgi:probable F420-dependent oxidoreductase